MIDTPRCDEVFCEAQDVEKSTLVVPLDFARTLERELASRATAGWKLVPVEPTPEIKQAMDDACDVGLDGQVLWGDIYRAALSASPSPQTEHEDWCGIGLPNGECTCGLSASPSSQTDDEPPVMGAGGGRRSMPTREEAEAVWRKFFAARLVERGLDQTHADEFAAAVDVDLSCDPKDAADDEVSYWDDDGDGPSPSETNER